MYPALWMADFTSEINLVEAYERQRQWHSKIQMHPCPVILPICRSIPEKRLHYIAEDQVCV